MSVDRSYRCRALVSGKPCTFEGGNEAAGEHWRETGHARCTAIRSFTPKQEPVLCGGFLTVYEERCCAECVNRVRDALDMLRDADLEPIIESTALHPGMLPGGNALVMAAHGNTDALRPYRPKPDSHPLDVPHGGLVGDRWCWLPYYEHREAADGREHYRDHWRSDPMVPAAELDAVATVWRRALGEMVPDRPGTASETAAFLLGRLQQAVRSAPDFEDDARTIIELAAQVANTTGTVNYPVKAPAKCFDCGGDLISPYREPAKRDHSGYLSKIVEQRRATDTYGLLPAEIRLVSVGRPSEGRLMAEPKDDDPPDAPPEPIWQCADRDCARIYEAAEYRLAVHAAVLAEAEAAG